MKSDYSRRKHVLLDEDTHLSLRSEERVIGSVPLRENVPSSVVLTYTGFASGFDPQEPRRPRFPFFHLHNVKELTPGPGSGRRRWKQSLPEFRDTGPFPVARQHLCPFEISALATAPQAARSEAMAVYMAGSFACQHPNTTKSTFCFDAEFRRTGRPSLPSL